MENNNFLFNKKQFLDNVIQTFFRKMQTGQQGIDRQYNGYVGLIENQIKKDGIISEKCQIMRDILDKSYRLFSDEEFRRIVTENNLTSKQLVAQYEEDILGDNKRKYNMSDMFNESYIAKFDNPKMGSFGRKVIYKPEICKKHQFIDSKGYQVIIEEIGSLYMEQWSGLKTSIPKYRIQRQVGEKEWATSEIYSHIIIFDMDNPDYRSAVLEELLSERNITLSKANGYVGEIEQTQSTMRGKNAESESMISDMYFYKINDKYSLKYEPADLSAVILYEQYQKARSSEKIVPMRRKSQNSCKEEGKTTNQCLSVDDGSR